MAWSEGRNLASLTTGGKTATYTYDMNGLRTKKTSLDGTWVKYFVGDGKILGETLYGTDNVWVYDMRYTFDENGDVCGISLWNQGDTSWTKYYFVKNLQGDVLAVYQYGSSFTKVAEYTYDSWGNVLTATGALANINPFRYRSYYRDADTGFYYLQSRYYDPAIGRFLNADSLASTGQDFLGFNMFTYCLNNPINRADQTGEFGLLILAAAALSAAINVTTTFIAAKATGQEYTITDALVSAAIGAVNVIPGVGPFIAGGISGGYSAYTAIKNGATPGEAILCFAVSAVATTASIGNLANLGVKSVSNIIATASADLVFGAGYNCIAAATNKGVAINAEKRKTANTPSTQGTQYKYFRGTGRGGNGRGGSYVCIC